MRRSKQKKIELLKKYFKKKKSVLLAFLFGSRAKKREMGESDWDIGVYFKPKEYLELETNFEYPEEEGMWSDLVDILKTDNVDLVVLNRARPDLVYTTLRDGIPLIIRDKGLYLDLLCKTYYEAIDWWNFVLEFYKIGEKAKSLSLQARAKVTERLKFLEREFSEIEMMRKITWNDYRTDSFKQKVIERWIERLVMAAIDIAQIFLASEKREVPESYQDVLKLFVSLNLKFSEKEAETFSNFAKLRNVVAHEYLDIKWSKIKKFVVEAEKLFPKFIKKVKNLL
jgi:uncharacterized protein YutE (UPF0331/DUF86 family)/predicted nucleotidyltransferase